MSHHYAVNESLLSRQCLGKLLNHNALYIENVVLWVNVSKRIQFGIFALRLKIS